MTLRFPPAMPAARFPLALAFLLTLSAPANAQALSCSASAGAPASLEIPGAGPAEYVVAAGSGSWQRPFVVKDAQGTVLTGIDVEIELPESPAELMFYQPTAGAMVPTPTPKRAIVPIRSGCSASLPSIAAGNTPGTVIATARVRGSSVTLPIPIRVVAPLAPSRRDRAPLALLVPASHISGGYIPAVLVEWSDGSNFGPLAGVPVTFTASGSILRFSNGTNMITVASDRFGAARAPAEMTAQGTVEVRATYPDGSPAGQWKYVALGAAAIQVNGPATLEYGSTTTLSGVARYAGFPCGDFPDLASMLSSSRARVAVRDLVFPASFAPWQGTCSGDVLTMPLRLPQLDLPFGVHEAAIEIYGHPAIPDASAKVQLRVEPAAVFQSATGRGRIRLGSADPGYARNGGKCSVANVAAVALADLPAARPESAALPYGALRFELANCAWATRLDFPAPTTPPSQRVLLELDEEPAPGTVAWAHGPTSANPLPHWHELRTTVVGRFVQFEVTDAGAGDDALASDRVIRSLVTLGVPERAAVAGNLQDLWWAGPRENGWGMSLTQHGDRLFAALFIYDAAGEPRWLVMSGGEWNASRTSYSGSLYRPKGSPYATGIAGRFDPGAPVGTLRLTPASLGAMRLDYTIDGTAGSKEVVRQPFGPAHPFPATRFDDLWWGGMEENGWGFALAQQQRTFFGVLYTYDANGEPIWFVAPSGTLTSSSIVESKVYRTRGAPWVGGVYDPARLTVTEAGTLRLSLQDGWESGTLTGSISGWRAISNAVRRQPF